jgi:16S rRNA U516 pseudouridylate synthase RsuA-like enzyme
VCERHNALTAASMHKQHLQVDTCKGSKHTRITPEGVCTLTGKRLFPVGRLDKDSSGLMLVTNDGRLGEPCSSMSVPRGF